MKLYKNLIIFGVLFAIGFGVYSGYQSTNFRLVSVTPTGTASTTAPIILTFNRSLSQSTTKGFLINPYTPGRVTVNDETLTFTPADNYHIDTVYMITVTNVTAIDGATLPTITNKFTATFKPINDLTNSERQAAAQRTDPVDSNPFLSKLPYETIRYKVEFSSNKDVSIGYQLNVTLFAILNNPDDPLKRANYQAQLVAYRTEANTWLKSQGVDTNKVKVSYTPDPDSPYGN